MLLFSKYMFTSLCIFVFENSIFLLIEPRGLQSLGSQRVRHDWANNKVNTNKLNSNTNNKLKKNWEHNVFSTSTEVEFQNSKAWGPGQERTCLVTEAGKDSHQGLHGKVYRDRTNNRSYLLHPPTGDLNSSWPYQGERAQWCQIFKLFRKNYKFEFLCETVWFLGIETAGQISIYM